MREGRRSRHRLVRFVVRRNGRSHNRYGFAVGSRVGGAVVRNKTKRRLREIMRGLPLAPGHDIVVIAEPASASAGIHELAEGVEHCAQRTNLLDGAQ